MKIFHFCWFLCVFASAFIFPVWVFGILALPYTFLFSSYEVLCVAVFVDSFFFVSSDITGMWYTVLAGAIVIAHSLLEPHLSMYDRKV